MHFDNLEISSPSVWASPEKLNDDIIVAIRFRYLVSAVAALLFYLLRDVMPYPYPQLVLMCFVLFFTNLVFDIALKLDVPKNILNPITLYLDAFFAPFTILYTGGFLSPFIITHYITAIGAANSYTYGRKQNYFAAVLMAILIGSYIGVSLLQKYSIIPAYVDYSANMMQQNTVFFYTLLFSMSGIMIMGFVLMYKVKHNLSSNFKDIIGMYTTIVNAVTIRSGEKFYETMATMFARSIDVENLAIFRISDNAEYVESIANVVDYKEIDAVKVSLKDKLFASIVKDGEFICFRSCSEKNSETEWVKNMDVDSFYAQRIDGKTGLCIGLIVISSKRTLYFTPLIFSVISILAHRISTEFENEKLEKEQQNMRETLFQSEKMESLGKLAGGVARDFNNMLNGIKGYAELTKLRAMGIASTDGPKIVDYSNKIDTICNSATAITSQLLAFARKGKFSVCKINVNKVVADVISISQHSFPKTIKITSRIEAEQPFAMIDYAQINNAILNLAINAKDSMDSDGEIIFETRNVGVCTDFETGRIFHGNYVEVSVSDIGCGIDESMLKRVFEPFYTTRELGKGTGFGLSSVYGAIKNHNGHIFVESVVGKGTTFRLYFDVAEEKEASKRGSRIIDSTTRGTILVVDDDTDIIFIINEYLTASGFTVYVYNDPIEALSFYKKNFETIDFVVTDIFMPTMRGDELFKHLKEINNDVVGIAISGFADNSNVEELKKLGVRDILKKPFSPQKLQSLIEKII